MAVVLAAELMSVFAASDMEAGWLIEDNVCESCPQGVYLNGGRENVVTRNTFINCSDFAFGWAVHSPCRPDFNKTAVCYGGFLDQLNALRRARDRSESRVRDLAKELQEAQMDKQAWGREEDALSRRVTTARGGGFNDPPARQEPSTPRFAPAAAPREPTASTPMVSRGRGGYMTSGSESDGGLTDASVSSARKHGEHPIFQKIRHGRVNEASAMLSGDGGGAGIDPDVRDRFGNTPLIVAAQNNRKRISKMCVKAGVPLSASNNMGNSALHYCYSYGYFELGEYLVSKGADPMVRNAEG